jgi:hypothetical protein
MVANAYVKTVSTFETDSVAEHFASFESGATWDTADYTAYKGQLPSETVSSKCLNISTDGELLRQANALGTAEVVTNNFYIDMMAKFNETESATIGAEDKLAIFMNASGKLVVVAGVNTNTCETTTSLTADTWYRVMIRMIEDISTAEGSQPGFVVSINGTNVAASAESYPTLSSLNDTAQSYYSKRELFPTIIPGATIKGLALTGVGSVDEIVFRTDKATDTNIVDPFDTGRTTYDIVDASGNVVEGGAGTTTIDYSTLNTGVYQVQATSDSGAEPALIGDKIGVIKIESAEAGKQVLISVPWKSLDGDNVRVADMFANPVEDDMVGFYVNNDDNYKWYTYTSGEWRPDDDAIAAGFLKDSTFAPGTAAFYKPATTHDIVLVGEAQDSVESTPVAATAGDVKWTAIGSTAGVEKSISEIISAANVPAEVKAAGASSATADLLAVQQADGNYKYYYIDNTGKVKKWPVGLNQTTDKIPAGRGFMYLSKTNTTATVSFGN